LLESAIGGLINTPHQHQSKLFGHRRFRHDINPWHPLGASHLKTFGQKRKGVYAHCRDGRPPDTATPEAGATCSCSPSAEPYLRPSLEAARNLADRWPLSRLTEA